VEARTTGSTVSRYEDLEPDADWESPKPGMGSKLAFMYKAKGGALSKVRYIFTTHVRLLNQKLRKLSKSGYRRKSLNTNTVRALNTSRGSDLIVLI